jgi:hypothetical protein
VPDERRCQLVRSDDIMPGQRRRKRRDSNPRVVPHLSLSRSATHRPAVTTGAVWAAHPPGAVVRDRHRSRANATTNATIPGPFPKLNLRSVRVEPPAPDQTVTGDQQCPRTGRGCNRPPGARYPSVCWPTRRRVCWSVRLGGLGHERRGRKSGSALGNGNCFRTGPFEATAGAKDALIRPRAGTEHDSYRGLSWHITGRAGDRAGPVTRTAPTSRG